MWKLYSDFGEEIGIEEGALSADKYPSIKNIYIMRLLQVKERSVASSCGVFSETNESRAEFSAMLSRQTLCRSEM